MVAHERRADTARVVRCDGDCPHSEAKSLWREAVDTFGPHVDAFRFLRRHGSQSIVALNGYAEGTASERIAFSPE